VDGLISDPVSLVRALQAGSLAPACHTTTLRIYYEDTDAGGIVYHASYLRFFERVRTDWLRSMGAVHRELAHTDLLQFVVRDLAIDYRCAARLDDLITVDVRPIEVRRASMRLAQVARTSDGEVLVTALVRVAAVHRTTGRPRPLPDWLLTKIGER
jgi:acyl-CoA thioester hydrolase